MNENQMMNIIIWHEENFTVKMKAKLHIKKKYNQSKISPNKRYKTKIFFWQASYYEVLRKKLMFLNWKINEIKNLLKINFQFQLLSPQIRQIKIFKLGKVKVFKLIKLNEIDVETTLNFSLINRK